MRVAVVGIRGMGKNHLSAAKQCSLVREVAGCDISEEVRTKVGAEFQIPTFGSVDAVLRDFKPQVLVVATPPNRHGEVVRAAFERGVAVLTEKPIAESLKESQELVALGERKGVPFQCGFQLRYCGMMLKVKSLIDAGELGTLGRVSLTQFSGSQTKLGYMTRERTGGIFYEKLCHQVDLFRYLLGEPERVMASAAPAALKHYGIDDNVLAVFAFPGGKQGVITFDTRRAAQVDAVEKPGRDFEGREAGHFYELTFTGDRGTAVYDAWTSSVDLMRFNHREDLKTEWVRRIDLRKEGCDNAYDLSGQDGDFFRCVAEGKPPRFPASDALKSMQWVERAEESLRRKGAWVEA